MAGSKKLTNQATWSNPSYPSNVELDDQGSSSSSFNHQSHVVTSWSASMELNDYERFRHKNPTMSTQSGYSKDPAVPAAPQNHTQRQLNISKGLAACGCRKSS